MYLKSVIFIAFVTIVTYRLVLVNSDSCWCFLI